MTSDGLQPESDGLQPISDGLQPIITDDGNLSAAKGSSTKKLSMIQPDKA